MHVCLPQQCAVCVCCLCVCLLSVVVVCVSVVCPHSFIHSFIMHHVSCPVLSCSLSVCLVRVGSVRSGSSGAVTCAWLGWVCWPSPMMTVWSDCGSGRVAGRVGQSVCLSHKSVREKERTSLLLMLPSSSSFSFCPLSAPPDNLPNSASHL